MASEDRLNLIISAVVTRLQGVTGIGMVYPYKRWASSDAAFQSMAMTGGVLHIWQVSRYSSQERWLTTGETWRVHNFSIEGAYGLLDEAATERTMQNVVERIAAKFRTRAAWTLDGLVESTAPYMGELASASVLQGAVGGVQVTEIAHRMINQKLANWAELRLGIQDVPQALIE